jgi:hypothetical protein
MHDRLSFLRPDIETELEKLQGYGMTRGIHDEYTSEYFEFDIDSEDPKTFCDFFKQYDRDGRTSCLVCFYQPDHECLGDFDSICEEIVATIGMLLPLYNAMVQRLK